MLQHFCLVVMLIVKASFSFAQEESVSPTEALQQIIDQEGQSAKNLKLTSVNPIVADGKLIVVGFVKTEEQKQWLKSVIEKHKQEIAKLFERKEEDFIKTIDLTGVKIVPPDSTPPHPPASQVANKLETSPVVISVPVSVEVSSSCTSVSSMPVSNCANLSMNPCPNVGLTCQPCVPRSVCSMVIAQQRCGIRHRLLRRCR